MTEKQCAKELQRQKVLFEEKCESGQYLDGSIKFADFAEMWFRDYADKQLRAKTLARYKELIRRINTAIGHIRLDKLQPMHLMRFYDHLAEAGIRNNISYIANIDINGILKERTLKKVEFFRMAGISQTSLREPARERL